MHPHFAGDMGKEFMSVVELYSKHGIRQAFSNRAFHQYCVFFGSDDADFPFRGWDEALSRQAERGLATRAIPTRGN